MTSASVEPRLVGRTGRALGSTLRLTFAGRDADADHAWVVIEQVFREVDAAMSRFREDSALTRLCRRSPNAVSGLPRMLVRALVAADRATRVTRGLFDPRIVAALERIGYAGVPQGSASEHLHDPAGRERAHRADPARPVLVRDGRTGPIALPVPVDLGGIGKGLALRWASHAVDAAYRDSPGSCSGYLLDAGGDIVTDGTPTSGEPWAVGIDDPSGATEPLAVLSVRGHGAVATSSIGRLHWEKDGRSVHHLIDPRTGEPGGDGLVAVTVAAQDPAWAEVWSKALFLAGSAHIAAAARRRDLAAWWVTSEGRLEMTPNARQRTIWVAGEA